MAIVWEAIEAALRSWVKSGSGLSDDKVYLADQDVAAPAMPYVTIRLGDSAGVARPYQTQHEVLVDPIAGQEIETGIHELQTFTVYLQAYAGNAQADKTVGSDSARAILSRVRTALALPSVRTAFHAIGLSPFDPGMVQNLTFPFQASQESRATLELRCYIVESVSEFVTYIESVEVTDVVGGEVFIVDSPQETPMRRHEFFQRPIAAGTVFIAAAAKADSKPKVASVQPDYPRPVSIKTANSWVSTAAITVTVTGKVRGVTDTEDIIMPANSANGDVVNGLKPFDTITNMTWDAPAGWTAGKVQLQSNAKMGVFVEPGFTDLAVDKVSMGVTTSPAAPGDPVIAAAMVQEAAAAVDATYGTWTPTTAFDTSHDYHLWYSYVTHGAATP